MTVREFLWRFLVPRGALVFALGVTAFAFGTAWWIMDLSHSGLMQFAASSLILATVLLRIERDVRDRRDREQKKGDKPPSDQAAEPTA